MKIAVVIPCYRVKNKILTVLSAIGPELSTIYVVDDCCPEKTGDHVAAFCKDTRVKIVYNISNQGVGGAVMEGYKNALMDNCDIVVKLDGDGQMDPTLVPVLIQSILKKKADYVKGNRFYFPRSLAAMPTVRLFGNSVLSLLNKFVNGYWQIMDPTNGFTAIHRNALELLDFNLIEKRYFFESDMLFRLSLIRAVVQDMPMTSKYADENSSLKIRQIIFEFPPKYIRRSVKRIFYLYFIRDFNSATLCIITGLPLFLFGIFFGSYEWALSVSEVKFASTGTVMIAVLPIILGFQLLLSALNFDVQNAPQEPLCR